MSNIVDLYLTRFKVTIIIFYSLFLCLYPLSAIEGVAKEILTIVWAICFFTAVGFFWYYLWNCAKLVGKNPLLYVFISILFSLLGPLVTYFVLKKAYYTVPPIIPQG